MLVPMLGVSVSQIAAFSSSNLVFKAFVYLQRGTANIFTSILHVELKLQTAI